MNRDRENINKLNLLLKSNNLHEKTLIVRLEPILTGKGGPLLLYFVDHYKELLKIASINGFLNVMQMLFDYIQNNLETFNLNPEDNYGRTPLHYAAKHGHTNIIQLIINRLKHDAATNAINAKDINNQTPIFLACSEQKYDVIYKLLNYKYIKIHGVGPMPLLYFFTSNTPSNCRIFERLRQLGYFKHESIVKSLFEDEMNEDTFLNFLQYIFNDRQSCVEFFEASSFTDCLISASKRGYLASVKAIWTQMRLNMSVLNFNPKGHSQRTPLHYAAEFGHRAIVREILEMMGPLVTSDEINPKDDKSITPLYLAGLNGHVHVMNNIWEKIGANLTISTINPTSLKLVTPLHAAAYKGHLSVVKAILNKIGPNASSNEINPKDILGKTPLCYAIQYRHSEIVFEIIARLPSLVKSTDMNTKDINGLTPLHYAAISGDISVFQTLLKKLGDVDIKEEINLRDVHERTPLYLACQYKRFDIIHRLLDYEYIEIKKIGPKNLFSFFNEETQNCKLVKYRLLQLVKYDVRNTVNFICNNIVDEAYFLEKLTSIFNNKQDTLVFYQNNYYINCLCYAAMKGYLCVMLLIWKQMEINGYTVDINPKLNNQNTPLHYAAVHGSLAIVQTILNYLGRNASIDEINPIDYESKTPLYKAIENKNYDIAHVLLDSPLTKVNNVGPCNLFTLINKENPECIGIIQRLRIYGCFELPIKIKQQDSKRALLPSHDNTIDCDIKKLRLS